MLHYLSAAHRLLTLLTALALCACTQSPSPSSPAPSELPVDYFPLKIGNRWCYTFSNTYLKWSGDDIYYGTATWEIVSAKTTALTLYRFQETINGVHIRTFNYGYTSGGDTTIVTDAKFEFTVLDSVGHVLWFDFYPSPSGERSPNAYLADASRSLQFSRVQPGAPPPDTVRYGQATDHSVILVKSVGLIKFRYHVQGTGGTNYEANLQSCSLK